MCLPLWFEIDVFLPNSHFEKRSFSHFQSTSSRLRVDFSRLGLLFEGHDEEQQQLLAPEVADEEPLQKPPHHCRGRVGQGQHGGRNGEGIFLRSAQLADPHGPRPRLGNLKELNETVCRVRRAVRRAVRGNLNLGSLVV